MEIARTQVLALAMLVVLTTSSSILRASAQGCGVDVEDLLTCLPYVEVSGPKVPPSPSCCAVLKNVDVPCLCKTVTSAILALVSPEKVVFVCRSCGLTIQPGLKCGGYTVPPKAPLLE